MACERQLDAYEVVQHLTVLRSIDVSGDGVLDGPSASVQCLIRHACGALDQLRASEHKHVQGLDVVWASLLDCCSQLLASNANTRAFAAHKHAIVSDVLWLCSHAQLHAGWRPGAGVASLLSTLLQACHSRHGMHYVAQEHLMVTLGMLLRGDEALLKVLHEEHVMATLCDALHYAHPELHPLLLQLLQTVIAASNADDFAAHHHRHLVRIMHLALTRNTAHDQAVVVCLKQCITMKLVEMREETASACMAQQRPPTPKPAPVEDDDTSESDGTIFEIEL